MNKSKCIVFGFNPDENEDHFLVIVPSGKKEMVQVYERFQWDEGEQKIHKKDILKLNIPKHKWQKVSPDITAEFNARLKNEKKPCGRFSIGQTPVEKLMGKELMVLLWGIENSDPSVIPKAIRNWKGLQPEERWWLYTMTNASTGGINDGTIGWRMALRYALCENPIGNSNQLSFFDIMFNEEDNQ